MWFRPLREEEEGIREYKFRAGPLSTTGPLPDTLHIRTTIQQAI